VAKKEGLVVKYEFIRPYLQTGDLVFFSGNGILSNIIKLFTLSKWSHVAIIIKIEDCDLIAILESTTMCNVRSLLTNKFEKGVQITPFSERLKKYNGEIAIRKLDCAEIDRNSAIIKVRDKLIGKPYEKSIKELFLSLIGNRGKENLNSIFCSELVAESYQALGAINDEKPSNKYVPADFAKDLRLSQGFSLGEIISIYN
jgi:hypothetical protein